MLYVATNIFQVIDNLINHQVEGHARKKGIDLNGLTPEEREKLKEEMIIENYPGKYLANIF